MVRPIDLQDNFSKAPLVSRIQQVQQNTPEMAHRQVNQEMTLQQLEDQSRPLPTEEGDRVDLHPDQNNGGQRRRRQEDREDEEAEHGESGTGHSAKGEDDGGTHIDIVA